MAVAMTTAEDGVGDMVFQDSVDQAIRRRGHLIVGRGDTRQVVYPFHAQRPPPEGAFSRYYELFGRSSFRKLVRRLIHARGQTVPIGQLEAMAGNKAHDYIDFLATLGVAEHCQGGVVLTRSVDSIGPSLEWYVARLCHEELGGKAEWSVRLKDLPVGGDYDVLAWLDPTLMYVELKSSAPPDISASELRNFLQRGEELAPDLAVLLVDTDDDLVGLRRRLFEIMLPLLKGAGGGHWVSWEPDRHFIRPRPGYPGISFGYNRFYVANSAPTMLQQLRSCLQHYNARVKGRSAQGGLPVNFVTGKVGDEL